MRKLLAAMLLMLSFQAAWAIDIHTAKDQGLVGESNTGYLAAVSTPASAEVQALIETVNAKRRSQFEKTAASTTATVEQVRLRFYELAVQKTRPGHYYQDPAGTWIKK
jgi:uncharacterized protein YdbL (DUF1318 family)